MTSNSNKTTPKKKFSDLILRLITGVLGSAFMIFVLVYFKEWGFFFSFLFLTIMTQLEFYKLLIKSGRIPLRSYGALLGVLTYTMVFLFQKQILNFDWFYIVIALSSLIYFIKLYKVGEEKPFVNIAFTFLGIFYVAVPIALLNVIAFHPGTYSYELVIGLFLILWASDTGAYFAGTAFGKRKLFESVSPKKSWEGSIGGGILSLAFALGVSHWFHVIDTWQWVVISLIVIVAGNYGDLVESLFKRSMHIKDSGKKLPGHGGFLDRFDGLLLSIPFIVVFLRMCAMFIN